MSKRSRVHPTYKTKYRVTNWASYDQALVARGDITFWLSPDALSSWNARPTKRRGGKPKHSDLAIETALTLRLLLNLPLRQTEGFLRSILGLIDVNLDAPDHTTLSRRSRQLEVTLNAISRKKSITLILDSTGLSIHGEGQWAAAKHGQKGLQGWKKLHLGVDADGVIVTQELTTATTDDGATGLEPTNRVDLRISEIIGDGAYDSRATYETACKRGAQVVVPPPKTAQISSPPLPPRDRAVRRIKKVGRRRWKKESGYHQQGRVENAFFRYYAEIRTMESSLAAHRQNTRTLQGL